MLANSSDNSVVVHNVEKNLDRELIRGAFDRNEKIKRFREQKEFEKQLEIMNCNKETCNKEHVDEEQKRFGTVWYQYISK